MSGIGGGLHDRDPEPDRHRIPDIVPQVKIKAAQREWAFWAVMVVGFWAAFQGQAMTALWFLLAIVIVLAARVVAGPVWTEISKTWRS